MRTSHLALLALSLTLSVTGCRLFKQDAPADANESTGYQTPPQGLEGPAYDPSTSPRPVDQAPPLRQPEPVATVPAGDPRDATPPAVGDSPAAYGNVRLNPTTAKGSPDIQQSPAPASAPVTYGSTNAPETYAAPAPNTAEAALASVLNGTWVNEADPLEVVAFTPDHYQTYYRGELLVEEDMTYHSRCPGDCAGGAEMDVACFTISGPAGTDCYAILRLTPEVLEMSMLGVSTEPIVYRRQQ